MSGIRTIVVDAFTRVPGLGNRAGVVPDAGPLDEERMQRAAAAVAAAETAFILPPTDGADVRLRYFTPIDEIAFCGHATVASFHWLAESGALAVPGTYRLDCAAGPLEIELERTDDGGPLVWMATPRHPWEPSPIAGASLMGLLGGAQGMRDSALPLERAGRHLYIAISKRVDLWNLVPRWDALTTEGERHGVRGFYVFTREAADPGSVSHGRYFAPSFGVREDPVTGSASGPLAEYLARHGVIALPPEGGTVRSRAEQGDVMGKPGRVELEVRGAAGAVEGVRVGGTAVTVLEGTLRV
jgi:trans-2,3-dihydro-3-hydroxyanthranilate isomerase